MSRLPHSLRGRGAFVWAGGALVLLYLVLLAASFVDPGFAGDDAARNVQLAGQSVAGADTEELTAIAEQLDVDQSSRAVTIDAGEGAVDSTAAELGLHVDVEATVAEVEDDDVALPLRPLAWIGSFFTTRSVEPLHQVDAPTLAGVAAELALPGVSAPTEPTLEGDEEGVRAVPGIPGAGLDPDDLATRLQDAADASAPQADLTIHPVLVDVPTVTSTSEAEAVAADAEDATDLPIRATAGQAEHEVAPVVMRRWLVLVADEPGSADWTFDDPVATEDLTQLFADAGSAGSAATFAVIEGQVVISGGEDPTACCTADAAATVEDAARSGASTVSLELRPGEQARDLEWAQGLGIVEPVATFTTYHSCCANRVTNIHLIADTARGVVIEPGETFSLNGLVGQRTEEKGYLPAGGITNGVIVDQLGGGISQFTTTLFNAAFFAGLDFGEYQAHSIYFSRYPYGREATLSYPHPDLQIVNTTPYGVLIWPQYSGTQITVTLYSTKYVDADQTGQTESAQGTCTRVRTERTRTYLDGRVEIDHVGALYRRTEGENCSGESSVPSTTTEPPPAEPAPAEEPPATTEGESTG